MQRSAEGRLLAAPFARKRKRLRFLAAAFALAALVAIGGGCSTPRRPVRWAFLSPPWWDRLAFKSINVHLPPSGPALISAFRTCLLHEGASDAQIQPENLRGTIEVVLSTDPTDGPIFAAKLEDAELSRRFQACGDRLFHQSGRKLFGAGAAGEPSIEVSSIRGLRFTLAFPFSSKEFTTFLGQRQLRLTPLSHASGDWPTDVIVDERER